MKNTKRCFKLSFLSTLLIIALVFSLLSYDTTTSKAEENKFMRYYDGNEIMYVNINNCIDEWWKDECIHRVYFFGEDEAWGTLEQLDDTGIFKVQVPKGKYNKVIICRCKDNDSTWDNNGVYNQTGDITILPDNDYICIFNGQGSKVAGWTTFEEAYAPIDNIAEANIESNISTKKGTMYSNNIQGGTILHAFCWTYDEIKNNMEEIAKAGYTAIQTSPVQPSKDYSENYTKMQDEWWKLYQPLGFCIAEKGYLGTKQQLIDMCTEADKYGIEIICDIVANHLAVKSEKEPEVLHKDVQYYEPVIYNNPEEYLHDYLPTNEYTVEGLVYGNISLPDLNTSNKYVQERVISLLKECIDCGVDGFRFDAAKHIETPDDGQYASDFWPTVTNEARNYALKENKQLYMYAEILSPLPTEREFASYTKYLDITDNRTSDITLNAIYEGNAGLTSSCKYQSGEKPSNLILWSESHDTYMNKDSASSGGLKTTKNVNESIINKGWAMVASRADTTSLYFARPNNIMGQVGSISWKSAEVSSINHFHNDFRGSKEYLSYINGIVINERYYNNDISGAIITNVSNNSNALNKVKINKLSDGQYIDAITRNIFTVTNGYISGNIGNTGIAVLYQYK